MPRFEFMGQAFVTVFQTVNAATEEEAQEMLEDMFWEMPECDCSPVLLEVRELDD